MPQHILIVEDEVKIAQLVHKYLQQSQFETTMIHHGDEVLPWFENNKPDLIVLDLMLPGTDGITLCQEIRKTSNVPIIMVTAKAEEIDRLLGLEVGADDYLCKPFSVRELVARVKTVLRRMSANVVPKDSISGDETSSEETASEELGLGISLDEDNMGVRIGNSSDGCTTVELTAVEFQLLKMLMSRPSKIFSRQHLMDNMYEDRRVVSFRTIDSHIKKLRKKLGDYDCIHSVYGVGYKFEIPLEG